MTLPNLPPIFGAIQYVTSSVTLLALVAACVAWIAHSWIRKDENLIKAAPENDRNRLVEIALDRLEIDTSKLTREQQFQLALQHFELRGRRMRNALILALVFLVLSASVLVVTTVVNPATAPPVKLSLSERVLKQWEEQHQEFIRESGWPGSKQASALFWYQFFEKGLILHNTAHGWSTVLWFETSQYEKVPNSPIKVTQHGDPKGEINEDVFKSLTPSGLTSDEIAEYRRMFEEQEIIGGIGATYLTKNLLKSFGKPKHKEKDINDILVMEGPVYDLLIGLMNSYTDHHASNITLRAVFVLNKSKGLFRKDTVLLPG